MRPTQARKGFRLTRTKRDPERGPAVMSMVELAKGSEETRRDQSSSTLPPLLAPALACSLAGWLALAPFSGGLALGA